MATEEVFGDALWYFTALARRIGHDVSSILAASIEQIGFQEPGAVNDESIKADSQVSEGAGLRELDEALLRLGESAAALITLATNPSTASPLMDSFGRHFLGALRTARISLARVVQRNLAKTRGRFLKPDISSLPRFDSAFEEDERLPDYFEIIIKQRKNGQSYLQWNGVFLGDPLTDNILDPDGYRFHDVFHLAHAAVLHWSPVFRALIKHKRKSDKIIDEAQDGGRAIVVEEGLTAWLFSRAKGLSFFEQQDGISFDLLKTIGEFVQGYEVQECPLKLWEDAILQGYAVFRQVKDHAGGVIVGDRSSRTIKFQARSG
jgi:hypothetical protein